MKITRKIIEIDEELCNGCGQCILDCAEHALIIENGKAKVISDHLCDGLGACLQACPQNALKIIEREASPFDEAAVHALQQERIKEQNGLISQHCFASSNISCQSLHENTSSNNTIQWPLKLRLIQADSKFWQDEFCLVADCVPPSYENFAKLRQEKSIFLACPKFESQDELTHKLYTLLALNQPKTLSTLRMEVPCCNGIAHMAEQALKMYMEKNEGSACTIKHLVLKRDGEFKNLS